MNPGYNEENWRIIQENAKLLDIPLTTFETQIFVLLRRWIRIRVTCVQE